ncbi:hypothetical protein [Planosporangium thailandense]|uniref:hypothetical protein n=1 Tax=Planosporangium thailandense TaxID=765197 RepID=UPI00197CAAED|nr:hypothetical protein [Planosporangium thailandense]
MYLAVDGHGRVIDVGFSTHWQQRLKPSDVGAALYEAYLGAVQKAQAATAIAALHSSGHEAQEPQPRTHEPEDNDRWIQRVWKELDQIEADRRRYAEADARTRAAQERQMLVTSPFGYLKVHLQGRHIVGVEADARRITEASANGLADDARAAFRAAQEADDGQ